MTAEWNTKYYWWYVVIVVIHQALHQEYWLAGVDQGLISVFLTPQLLLLDLYLDHPEIMALSLQSQLQVLLQDLYHWLVKLGRLALLLVLVLHIRNNLVLDRPALLSQVQPLPTPLNIGLLRATDPPFYLLSNHRFHSQSSSEVEILVPIVTSNYPTGLGSYPIPSSLVQLVGQSTLLILSHCCSRSQKRK